MSDPLSSFDLKPLFLDFLENLETDQDTPPQQSLAHSFIGFLKFISEGNSLEFSDQLDFYNKAIGAMDIIED
jgi:hypothetical protein